MAKYFGKIGFVETIETSPGVWEEQVIERFYRGDVTRNVRKWDNSSNLNDNISLGNSITIVADDYILNHCYAIRYVTWRGARWEVSTIDVQRPRLVLSFGGVYNGNETPASPDSN